MLGRRDCRANLACEEALELSMAVEPIREYAEAFAGGAVTSLSCTDTSTTIANFASIDHLGRATPLEAWRDIDPYELTPKAVELFTAWGGLLTGYYLRR